MDLYEMDFGEVNFWEKEKLSQCFSVKCSFVNLVKYVDQVVFSNFWLSV